MSENLQNEINEIFERKINTNIEFIKIKNDEPLYIYIPEDPRSPLNVRKITGKYGTCFYLKVEYRFDLEGEDAWRDGFLKLSASQIFKIVDKYAGQHIKLIRTGLGLQTIYTAESLG